MDFISNLIKRPISLVLNETSTTIDKYPISTSLPNAPIELENKKDLITSPPTDEAQKPTNLNFNNNNSKRSLSLSSSYNGDNMTDFIGVPEDFLDEFKDILPPPPALSAANLNPLTQSLLDMDNSDCFAMLPPASPLSLHLDKEDSLTSSMKASQTIDKILLEINDNLQQAGLSGEVVCIASPSQNSELSPLSSKAALSNSKLLNGSSTTGSNTQLNTSKISTTTDGSFKEATVFENNSLLHKFHIDSETGQEQQQCGIEDQLISSGVNKASNKFVGLTEFDEAKIPELPGDLNPNIEEQYGVTFEKCFIPTSNVQQGLTFADEFKFEKTNHQLFSTETDCISSDNETFADCHDERDPLTSTFAEPTSLDLTELDSYQSAINKSLNSSFNHTMENISDITIEAENYPLKINQRNQVDEHFHNISIDEIEPMDIDMNSTMEIMQHAENILQHLEDKSDEIIEKQTETPCAQNTSSEGVANKTQTLDNDNSKHDLSLNECNELPVNKEKHLNSECVLENSAKIVNQNKYNDSEQVNNVSDHNINLTNDLLNSSTLSNSSSKSEIENKSEEKLNVTSSSSTSIKTEKYAVANSTAFPIKTAEITGFPRSPKALNGKPNKAPFLEKSDYIPNIATQIVENRLLDNSRENFVGSSSDTITNSISGTCTQPAPPNIEITKTGSCVEESLKAKSNEEQDTDNTNFQNHQNQTISNDILDEEKLVRDKRRTFNIESNASAAPTQFPSIDSTDKRRTFGITDTDNMDRRRTFNLPSEELVAKSTDEINLNTSVEPMEVDCALSPNNSISEQISQSHASKSLSPPLSTMQQIDQSPPLTSMQPKFQSPPLPTQPSRCLSPPLPAMQTGSQTPPLSNVQPTSKSPPLQAMARNYSEIEETPLSVPDSISEQTDNIKEKQISPHFALQPLSTLIQKRPSIRDARLRNAEILSAKEQTNIKFKDEKDIVVEKLTPSPVEDVFTEVSATSTTLTNSSGFSGFDQTSSSSSSMINAEEQQSIDLANEFSGNSNIFLNPSDFDYLLTKGNNCTPVDRSSLLLKFDPLLGIPVPVNQGQQQLQVSTNTNNICLSPTLEEEEHNDSKCSFVIDTKSEASAKLLREGSQEIEKKFQLEQQIQRNKRQITQGANKKNATMSADVIKDMSLDNDCNKAFENSNSTQSDDKQINYKMDELEKKIKNEVLKTEDIEKKLQDAEQREEALIKRITEKDKTVAKMTGVIEAYEKAIAELIADKEQLTQHYEKQLAEAKADRDSNYHHLTSLETTFSDLHVKYEKSKEMTCQLKESEEALQAEKRKNLENLHLQEQRYDKMKNHAMQQLEIANKKLESLTREHSIEITKLKALLKKEEIARSSINEQLAHKTKENAELVKICDELISGQGSNFSFEPFDPKKH